MQDQLLTRRTVLLFAALATISVAAAAKDVRNLNLSFSANLNGTQLSPGEYKVSWVQHSPEATVTFTKGKSVAATSEGKWVQRATTYRSNSVVCDTNPDGSRTILEIRFAGMNQALVFGENASSDAAQPKSLKPTEKTPAANGKVSFLGKPRVQHALVQQQTDSWSDLWSDSRLSQELAPVSRGRRAASTD